MENNEIKLNICKTIIGQFEVYCSQLYGRDIIAEGDICNKKVTFNKNLEDHLNVPIIGDLLKYFKDEDYKITKNY